MTALDRRLASLKPAQPDPVVIRRTRLGWTVDFQSPLWRKGFARYSYSDHTEARTMARSLAHAFGARIIERS